MVDQPAYFEALPTSHATLTGFGLGFGRWALGAGHRHAVTGARLWPQLQMDDNVASVEPGISSLHLPSLLHLGFFSYLSGFFFVANQVDSAEKATCEVDILTMEVPAVGAEECNSEVCFMMDTWV